MGTTVNKYHQVKEGDYAITMDGGPGSGRKPEGKTQQNLEALRMRNVMEETESLMPFLAKGELHSTLVRSGFKPEKDSDGVVQYRKGDIILNKISDDPNENKWQITRRDTGKGYRKSNGEPLFSSEEVKEFVDNRVYETIK